MLTNYDEVCIPSLFSILLAVLVLKRIPIWFAKKIKCCDPGKEIETSIYQRENLVRYFRCY